MKVTIEDYKKGLLIAKEISSAMQSDGATCDLEKYEELTNWLRKNRSSQKIVDRLSNEDLFTKLVTDFNCADIDEHTSNFFHTVKKLEQKRRRKSIFIKLTSGIAAAIMIVSFVLYLPDKKYTGQSPEIENRTEIESKIVETPLLILGSGKKIELNQAVSKVQHIAEENSGHSHKNSDLNDNIITVPKKLIHTVILEDGTKVTLNANSELRYPTKFGTEKREVSLKGEGFFEVCKGEKPFVVKIDDMEITVYGTKFNINSYNSNKIQTVLIEGSVGISISNQTKEIIMKPNQMVELNENLKWSLQNVDVSLYVAWLDGFIKIENQPLGILLDKLIEWYGVEIECGRDLRQMKIDAYFDLSRPFEEALKIVELMTDQKIEKRGGQYMIL